MLEIEKKYREAIKDNRDNVKDMLANISSMKSFNKEKIEEIYDTLSQIDKDVGVKNTEISKLKKGYDFELVRHFARRFARLHAFIENNFKDTKDENILRLKKRFSDALEESKIVQIKPSIGEDYTIYEDYVSIIDTKKAEDISNKGKICAVHNVGYKYELSSDKYSLITKANIDIYK